MKKTLFATLLVFLSMSLHAQESQTAYNFLRLPVSAHVAAMGGDNITLIDDDASLVFHNPALIQNVSDLTMNLNMMTYMQGTITGSASFVRAWGERASWGVSGRFMSYGSLKETNERGEELGHFSPHDFALAGTFAYGLTEHISGGITAKLAASYMGPYNSLAALVDLGFNFCDDNNDWSISVVARNLGGQLDAFENDFERMPLDVQIGVSKQLFKLPLRLSVTMVKLNDWENSIGRHFVFGADASFDRFYVALGYNPLRFSDMKISSSNGTSSHLAGFSIGAGMRLNKLKLHVAYAKYHVSASSLLINLSYHL